jgi:hypothetical protein
MAPCLYWTSMAYRYRPEVLEALARHGVVPLDGTPPARVREHVNDLYRYEIRRLRSRLLRGDVAKADYIDHVLMLRGRYLLLSMPVGEWVVEDSSRG